MMTFAVVIVTALRSLVRSVLHGGRDSPNRALLRDARGNLVAIGGRERTQPYQLSGEGRRMSVPLQLGAGAYRIDYQFQINTRLALLDETGDAETLVMGLGAGTKRFDIPEAGTYRLLVEPTSENGTWTVTYRQSN